MTSKVLLAVASTLEAFTGLGLIIAPTMVKFFLGPDISGAAITIAQMAGFGLLLLGIVCWPRVGPIVPRLRAVLIYNVLVATHLGYLRFGAESVGRLLLPAIASAGYSLHRRLVQIPRHIQRHAEIQLWALKPYRSSYSDTSWGCVSSAVYSS
jgi:hypothetical protein